MGRPSASVLRTPLILCAALAAILLALSARAGDPVPDVDVILEQNPGGIVKVESHSGGFDEIEVKVGKDFAKALSPLSLPEGWTLETDGRSVRLAGPAVAADKPVRFKLDPGSAPRPEKISYWVRLEGRTLLERKKVPAKIVPPQQVAGSLQGVVTMPTQVAPGEPMQMRVEDDAELPPGGTWMLSGTVVAAEEGASAGTESGGTYFASVSTSRTNLKKTVWGETTSDGTVDLVVPADLEPGDSLALLYVDAFGEVVVAVPEVPGVEVVAPRPGGEPRITDATPRAFAGRRACVCGTFPGPEAWNRLLLDGEALGPPVSASSRMAWVELPPGLAPGEHVFTGAPEPGFPAEDRASTLVLQVGGELDSSKLQRLETTPMRLWVEGTEEPLDLRVRNLTPGIISIDGGADQVIRTSGGSPNQLERTVRGLSPGDFNIRYELAGEDCPCGASPDVELQPAPGGVMVQVDPGLVVASIRVWVSEADLAAMRQSTLPAGWSIDAIDPGGAVTFAGPPTAGPRIRLRLSGGGRAPLRVALGRSPGRGGSSRTDGKAPQTLGETIETPFGKECECKTVPCPQTAGTAAAGSPESAFGGKGKDDQLLGGANPLKGLNVAKPKCQECDCPE